MQWELRILSGPFVYACTCEIEIKKAGENEMKKTKIICTMGPNTNDRELMKKLVENGMDIARFNFSHGDHEEQKSRMDIFKAIREEA